MVDSTIIGVFVATGVFTVGFIITMVLTSVIITSSLNDIWIKPGEQIVIQSKQKFSVTPQKDGIIAHIFPSGLANSTTETRFTNENFDGTINSTSLKEIVRFHARCNDSVYIEFNPEQHATLELFYYKTVVTTKNNRSSASASIPSISGGKSSNKDEDNDNPITPQRTRRRRSHSSGSRSSTTSRIVRFSVFTLNGTGFLSNSSMLPEDLEYIIGVNGTVGAAYDVNITYEREYYVSDDVINCSAGEETFFNNESKKSYHAVIEMEYDGPITEPENSKNVLDLYRAERYNGGDIAAIIAISVFFGIFLILAVALGTTFAYMEIKDRKKKKSRSGFEMSSYGNYD